ncbi:hypothetical protein DE146DRAFT_200036 [Phaeosphaeria sp. MPI-PUGE-AT-0046c]|nr:hypothetical protein DE146DRAFT_321974 [Phaeosphaeria sp. MPI-PUGE-AT-0046c]KAH7385357.1 hypothetical protein DE146DRAFT_200036 [Phaeosphaeria sp. MPI-PUGE-AT-0046c]
MPTHALTGEEADILAVRNQTMSPILCLPAELRNRNLEYAFDIGTVRFKSVSTHTNLTRPLITLHVATIHIDAGAKIISILLRRTTVCRQIRAETAALPIKLNAFAVDISQLVDMGVIMLEIDKLAKLPSLYKLMLRPIMFPEQTSKLVKNFLCKGAGENAEIVELR